MIRMHIPLARPQPWVLPVTLVCLALGMLVAFMLKARLPKDVDITKLSRDQLAALYTVKVIEKENLQQQLDEMKIEYNRLVDKKVVDLKLRGELQTIINDLRVRAGTTPVEGPGIVITIDDSKQADAMNPDVNVNPLLAHDMDLLQIVNELRSAGAEAIAINDQRVAGSSAIRCVGPAIKVNDQAVSAPFVVRAVGKPDVLYGAVNMPYGIVDVMRKMDIRVEVSKRETILLPAVSVVPSLEVGHPILDTPAKGANE